ncbi:DUF6402 family protein [Burkholderia cenocepacia]|uniref:DUF6402 family protein n=1 Tax=Burkholderia cenocepacia TaxID=95486 RepID=UPI0020A1D115|nr:DUF6402 family protein [Burkholderia cenocepacia]MCO8321134.1 hypothetical protein [Burkholderia cenocepacia]MCO8328606.1 hypothetical protein [Burkholderia cenocepacia]MCO8335892.1 hypothetical protein [Burkholderia cenocepacia]MCO8342989.1 hypothetical protein [Burkholderia cenocepacia]MCO8356271.1 hypothetical protein [Burkholderia cenocepacia]
MAKVKRLPYYQISPSVLPFTAPTWKAYVGSQGCVPINTPQCISYARLAPGEDPPPPSPKPTPEQIEAEAAFKKLLAAQPKAPPKPPAPPKEAADAEDHDKIPEFDLQDVPVAMEKMGWFMAAKLARRWFAGSSHIYNDKPDSEQPLDDTTITLNWALKYGKVKDRLNELLSQDIYSEKAFTIIKKKILQHATAAFTETTSQNPNLSFDTNAGTDIRQFHIDWQIQRKKVTTFDTLSGTTPTDLTATLGNFLIYAAIGKVEVTSEKFFSYEKKTPEFCVDSVAKLTHIYIYIKDNYSFNDDDPSKSQYLGHWNKTGMITSYLEAANDLLGQVKPELKMRMSGDKIEEDKINWDYLSIKKETDKPVDARRGFFGKLVKKDVYWPVYNRTYNEWRSKHNRGEDFMIYSNPQLFKLTKPIIIKLETICRPYDSTSLDR